MADARADFEALSRRTYESTRPVYYETWCPECGGLIAWLMPQRLPAPEPVLCAECEDADGGS